MNIFAVDADPGIAARSLVDRHVVKMVLESVQLLCVVHAAKGNAPEGIWGSLAWSRHPCARWASASRSNYAWLISHAAALADEYRHRYGRTHVLESGGMLARLAQRMPPIPDIGSTPFAEATGDIHGDDPVATYRRYYLERKAHLMVWTRREPPGWVAAAMQVSRKGDRWFAGR